MPRGLVPIPIEPPEGGVRKDKPFHRVPQGYLPDSENMMIRDGVLIMRPGFIELVATAPSANRVMGLAFYKNPDLAQKIVAATKVGAAKFEGTTWTDITGAAFTGTDSNQVRMVPYNTGGTTLLIFVNDKDATQKWDGGAGNYAALGGTPPIARDVLVSAYRLVLMNVIESGTRSPSRVRVSAFNDAETWPASLTIDLSSTPDTIVGGAQLSRTAFGVLKDESQWIGIAQGGLNPFRFELIDTAPGPVSPAAIVQRFGAHYYMGQDGSFFKFDGIRSKDIGKTIHRYIIDTMDFTFKDQVQGVYRKRDRQIWWYYTEKGGSGIKLGVSLHLDTGRFEPLRFGESITASAKAEDISVLGIDDLTGTIDGLDTTYPTIDSMGGSTSPAELIGAADGQVHKQGIASGDNVAAISAFWTLPLLPYGGHGKVTRHDAFDTFFKKTGNSVSVSVSFGKSDTLAAAPVFNPVQVIDISVDQRHKLTEKDLEGRFVTVKHSLNSNQGDIEWQGGQLYVSSKGVD